MTTVRDRLHRLERALIEVKGELKTLQRQGAGVVPEYADLKTISRMFGQYCPATLRHRVREGGIPASIVRKEGRKILINVGGYRREIFEKGTQDG